MTPTQKPTQQPNQQWLDYLHRDEDFDDANKISAISEGPTEELRLADMWIGNNVQLDEKGSEPFNDLQRDLFWILYRYSGMKKEEIPASRIVNSKIIDWLSDGASWQHTHGMTAGRKAIAQASASIMTESLLSDPEVQRLIEDQHEIENKEQQAQQAEQQAEEQSDNGNPAGAEKSQQQADDLRQQVQAMMDELSSKMDGMTDSMKGRAVQAAVNSNGKEEAQETSDMMSQWGIDEGDGETMDAQQLEALSKMVRENGIDKLAQMIGRAKGVAQGTLSTRKTTEIVLTDAGQTQALDDIFADELMMLSPSIPTPVRALQMAELLDAGLLGIVKATETKQEGNLLIAVDGSGSMRGQREMLSKALTLGIADAADENGQGWQAFTFGSGRELTEVITGETDLMTRLKWATFLFGGGTDFDMALRYAIQLVEESEDPSATDIVMITDGEAEIENKTHQALIALKEKYGVRLIGILVDTGYQSLQGVADATILVNGTQAIEKAADELSKALWK
jgi:uncharacterized protein with von Willebrand factor type A (vWA) domain